MVDLADLKPDIDKLDNDELKHFSDDLSQLQSNVDKTNVEKPKTLQVDLKNCCRKLGC